MAKKKLIRAMSLLIGGVIGVSCMSGLIGCGGKKKDSIVLMTEELSGLFNPFYATSGADMDVVGMTQISMLTTDKDGKVTSGDDLPTVVKDFEIDTSNSAETVYTFVIKNGLKFSDGVPITMNDVLFNMYEYLDPVYTGSSTMYSIKIKGLSEYRTKKTDSSAEDLISSSALGLARLRRLELITLYKELVKARENAGQSTDVSDSDMRSAISSWDVSDGYKNAVATEDKQAEVGNNGGYYRDLLLKDYELVCTTFREELESDYKAAKESFDLTTAPYKDHAAKLANDVFKFFLYEGVITPVYKEVMGKKDRTVIERFEGENVLNTYNTEEKAIQKVYLDNMTTSFDMVLQGWGTAGTVLTEFQGAATEIVIKNNMGSESLFPNISGIVSLGHTTSVNSVTVNDVSYTVAHQHNADGTPANENQYDVLQITVEGQDPKAIYNFGFSVAPAHYYGVGGGFNNGNEIDIANNKFGVEFASSSFQSDAIKALEHVKVPVGAGPYMASNRDNGNNPKGSDFVSGNIVYYKANPHFMFEVKTEKLRMQVVGASDALDVLESGAVDYVTPQFTSANSRRLASMKNDGFEEISAWQLGYGYIGINAGKVPDLGVRKAIMSAMQTSLALKYYDAGTCENIDWPMSNISWAYPRNDDKSSKQNGHDYTQWTTRQEAVNKIRRYAAGASRADLKITFTIAGASITEHPTYAVFKQAAEILNEDCGDMGWDITVKADTQALTKLATGSLAVWAAAWGSTIDPDMYQVYHKNSSATSVYAWGYREIALNPSGYKEETTIISKLSEIIDDARSTTDEDVRRPLYEQAMGLVLDLAIEMPVYQRMTLYAYNSKAVKGFNADVNPYTSPLEKVWELELVK